MQTVLNIPKVAGEPLVLNLSPGNPIFVVGPNGSGKSALIQHAVMSLETTPVKRIAAHRQLSLRDSNIGMTAILAEAIRFELGALGTLTGTSLDGARPREPLGVCALRFDGDGKRPRPASN